MDRQVAVGRLSRHHPCPRARSVAPCSPDCGTLFTTGALICEHCVAISWPCRRVPSNCSVPPKGKRTATDGKPSSENTRARESHPVAGKARQLVSYIPGASAATEAVTHVRLEGDRGTALPPASVSLRAGVSNATCSGHQPDLHGRPGASRRRACLLRRLAPPSTTTGAHHVRAPAWTAASCRLFVVDDATRERRRCSPVSLIVAGRSSLSEQAPTGFELTTPRSRCWWRPTLAIARVQLRGPS